MRELLVKIQNLVRFGFVTRASVRPQVELQGGDVAPSVQVLEPQGLHFRAPVGASGMMLAPNAVSSEATLVSVGGDVPAEALNAGEGGLHYLGAFKVFLAEDGTLHLGSKMPADFVALASLVDARISAIQAKFDAHVHPGVTAGGASTSVTPTLIGPLPSVASAKLKAE